MGILISVILALTWINNGILQNPVCIIIGLILIICLIVTCNFWVYNYFQMREVAMETISWTAIWLFSLFLNYAKVTELLLLTLIFFYIRSKYLEDEGE